MRHAFDCVVTCFFIDTAHNIVEYLEVINYCLKPGGKWVNLGPLLWHWADSYSMVSGAANGSQVEVGWFRCCRPACKGGDLTAPG